MTPSISIRSRIALVAAGVGIAAFLMPPTASAADWGFSLDVPFFGVRAHDGRYYYDNDPYVYRDYPYRTHPYRPYYYPYRNPVVDRDVDVEAHGGPAGTIHSQRTTEDRHRSYYNPGRNQAITEPRTSVERDYGPGYERTRERTTWIGADGQPHSTTINRTTTQDPYGDTHTETHVDLKSKDGADTDRGDRAPNESAQPKPGAEGVTPSKQR
jgi:hypothetical protein